MTKLPYIVKARWRSWPRWRSRKCWWTGWSTSFLGTEFSSVFVAFFCLCPVPGLGLILMVIQDADQDPVLKLQVNLRFCTGTGIVMYGTGNVGTGKS